MATLDIIFAQNWIEQFREDYPVAGGEMVRQGVLAYCRTHTPDNVMMDLHWRQCRNPSTMQARYAEFCSTPAIRLIR